MGFFLDNSNRTYITSDYSYKKEYDKDGNGIITELNLSTFPTLPTKSQIKKYLSLESYTFKKGSVSTETKYYGAIAFNSVWGWTSGYEIQYFVDQKTFERYSKQPFASEPTNKKIKRNEVIF